LFIVEQGLLAKRGALGVGVKKAGANSDLEHQTLPSNAAL